jgi:para-nitrobenzyl esterase
MKSILFFCFTLFSLTLISQECGDRYQSEVFSNVDVTTVDFGSNVNLAGNTQILQMDIYQAQGDSANDRPVVIFCFGGSFYAGDRNSPELVSFATSFAKRGYVCASIDYRLAPSVFDLVDEEKMVKVVFGAVQDGKAAIRYFRKNADEGNSLGIDPDQIFIGGTSAGGILAINLAYVDTLAKLNTSWQSWASEIGGLEGESGNPDYCSYVSGVFSFAGAVGDTSFINPNDVPFYSCHATGDQTVLYNYGPPLNGLAPVNLYGSGDIETRLTNLGIYNTVDTYSGGDHPPLGGNNYDTTEAHLSTFLYNLLDCNSANLKHADQQDCEDFTAEPIDPIIQAIANFNQSLDFSVYTNPSAQIFYVKSEKNIDKIVVLDVLGRTVLEESYRNEKNVLIDLNHNNNGIYTIKVLIDNNWQNTSLIKN